MNKAIHATGVVEASIASETSGADMSHAPEPAAGYGTATESKAPTQTGRGQIRFRDRPKPWVTESGSAIGPAQPPTRKETP